MLRSMYSGVTGLRAHQQKMDVIGNNISNVNTYGFKTGRATMKDSFYQTLQGATDPGRSRGGGNPMQVGYGAQINSIDTLHRTGGFAPTEKATDVMIAGEGFFLVGPDIGGATVYNVSDADNNQDNPELKGLNLTRLGTFNFDGEGNLVDANRNFVYGYMLNGNGQIANVDGDPLTTRKYDSISAAPEATLEERKLCRITLPKVEDNGNLKPMNISGISIGKDGKIIGIGSVNGKEQPVYIGQIAIATVTNPDALQLTENSYFRAMENVGNIKSRQPGEGKTANVISGGLEMSNVDLATQFSDMITTQRGFQANTKIITVSDEMLQELVNMKR